MEVSKRSIRRHHNERLKSRRKNYHRFYFEDPNTPRRIGVYLHTPALCSCWMCGNPRKHYRAQTLKEEVFADIHEDGLKELS